MRKYCNSEITGCIKENFTNIKRLLNATEIHRIIIGDYGQLYSNKLVNQEVAAFMDT